MRIAALIGSMIVALLLGAMPASAGTRVALVIGNSAYQNAPFLPNPVNDAADLSASLRRLGFDVKTLTNARYADMRQALSDFDQQARGAEFALIFFAGNGFQIGGENWLIPVDAQLAIDLDVVNETIGLQSLMRAVSNTTKLGLVILDASRNDPFRAKMQSTNLSRAVERGFSRVEPPDNVLVAYTARDGTTASDGSGRNSPFMSSLLKSIETPDLQVRSLLAKVRDDVIAATKQEQQPLVYGSPSKTPPLSIDRCRQPSATNCGWIGLGWQQVTEDVASRLNIKPARGAYILQVNEKSPAKPAGLEPGDVVLRFDGEDIKDFRDLTPAIRKRQVGMEVSIVVVRNGTELTKTVTVGRLMDRQPVEATPKLSPAAFEEYRTACTSSNEDARIDGCTHLLDSGTLTSAQLVPTYMNRASAWAAKREYDPAISDYNEAIRLNPHDPDYTKASQARARLEKLRNDH